MFFSSSFVEQDFETSCTVWKAVCGILHQVQTLTWPSDDMANLFEQFCLDTLQPVIARVGHIPNPKESSNDTILRSIVFCVLANLGEEQTLTVAKELFRNHVESIAPGTQHLIFFPQLIYCHSLLMFFHTVPASLREAVFRAVMVNANQQTLQQMLMVFRGAELAEERVAILHALGCAHDPNILSQCLEFSLSSTVHPQEAIALIVSASLNRYGYKASLYRRQISCEDRQRKTRRKLRKCFMMLIRKPVKVDIFSKACMKFT